MLNMFKIENQISDVVLLLRLVTFNPFVPNAYFLYSLKTSENLTVFWGFQGVEKGCIGNELVNKFLAVKSINPFHKTDLFLYFLKTSENKRFCDICWGYGKIPVAWNGLSNGSKSEKLRSFTLLKIKYVCVYVCVYFLTNIFLI